MAYTKNLTVQYHQQDTDYYCGAACAQMVLETVGSGIMGQAGLYNDNHSHGVLDPTVSWATPPDGLEWTLDHRPPASFQMRFVTYATPTEDAISRKIAWTIEHYEVAPVALVFGWAHWIVVRGMVLSDAPTSSVDTGFTFTSFRVNDPWPPVPSSTYWPTPTSPPPPPHAATDNCGTGGNRGVADQIITYTQWQNTYMTGVPSGHWSGLHVAVCDPEPALREPGRPTRVQPRDVPDRLLTRRRAATVAQRSLAQLEVEDDGAELWERARRSEAAEPALVQRLDRNDEFYYIAPFQMGEQVSAAAVVDARSGEFLQAATLPDPLPDPGTYLHFRGTREITQMLAGRDIELADHAGSVRLRQEAIHVPDVWFWKPCLESMSPLWPFKLIVAGGQVLYMRVDGQVFPTLHDQPVGA